MATTAELTVAYHSITRRLVRSAGDLAANTYLNLGSWRDEDATRYISLMTRALGGIKRQASNLTVGYYREVARNEGQNFVAANIPSSDLTTAKLRLGADAQKVYERPFVDTWTALKAGKNVKEAIETGAIRARSLATTEIQLAKRNAGLAARNANDGIVGYIRTLSGFENCALCYVASTQRYRRGDLLPIHPGCDCGEQPIYGTQDPGQIINEQRLEAVHEAVENRFGISDRSARAIDYRQIAIREHGELGPVLTVRGQHFDGPSSIPK
jgi:hypothetical protein